MAKTNTADSNSSKNRQIYILKRSLKTTKTTEIYYRNWQTVPDIDNTLTKKMNDVAVFRIVPVVGLILARRQNNLWESISTITNIILYANKRSRRSLRISKLSRQTNPVNSRDVHETFWTETKTLQVAETFCEKQNAMHHK